MKRYGGGQLAMQIVMRNGSDEPVYDVRVVMEHPDQPGTVTFDRSWDHAPPGQHPEQPRPVSYLPGPITLTFTDAAGCRWTRYPDGRLIEVEDSDATGASGSQP